ncbi:hypothetical protein BX616_000278, partial [Lobosporangium transversale]
MSISPTNSTHAHQAIASTSASATGTAVSTTTTATTVPHIRIVPHLDAPRSLHFDVVDKDVPEGFVLKIGRFTDKQSLPNRVTFKSKVVSRGHAEIFTENGKVIGTTSLINKILMHKKAWFASLTNSPNSQGAKTQGLQGIANQGNLIVFVLLGLTWSGLVWFDLICILVFVNPRKYLGTEDTKSSSGTFLNHARLSPPGVESKPTLLKDGDVIQLGVDYQGGTQ